MLNRAKSCCFLRPNEKRQRILLVHTFKETSMNNEFYLEFKHFKTQVAMSRNGEGKGNMNES